MFFSPSSCTISHNSGSTLSPRADRLTTPRPTNPFLSQILGITLIACCGIANAFTQATPPDQPPAPAPAKAEVAPQPLKPLDAAQTLFRDFTVLTMDGTAAQPAGVLKNHSVLIRDGRIEAIAPAADLSAPADATVIEGKGTHVLMPGFADLHLHFPPFKGDLGDAAWRVSTLLLCNGVTTARGMQGHEHHIELRRKIVAGELLAPTAHMGSPPIVAQIAPTPEAAAVKVRQFAQAGYDFIKSHRVINRAIHAEIIKAARESGIPVTGHVDNEIGLNNVIGTGQQIEHLDGFFADILKQPDLASQFGQVVPKALANSFDFDKIPATAQRLASANVWSGPTLALFRNIALSHEPLENWTKRPELKYVPNAGRNSWAMQRQSLAQPELFGDAAHGSWFIDARNRMLRAIRDAGGRVLVCSDSPQMFMVAGFATHDEMQAMADAGLPNAQVLAAATSDAAAYFASLPNRGSVLGIEPDFGVIAKGKRADLVVLREDPLASIDATRSIESVVLRGKVLTRADLDRMLGQVEMSIRALP